MQTQTAPGYPTSQLLLSSQNYKQSDQDFISSRINLIARFFDASSKALPLPTPAHWPRISKRNLPRISFIHMINNTDQDQSDAVTANKTKHQSRCYIQPHLQHSFAVLRCHAPCQPGFQELQHKGTWSWLHCGRWCTLSATPKTRLCTTIVETAAACYVVLCAVPVTAEVLRQFGNCTRRLSARQSTRISPHHWKTSKVQPATNEGRHSLRVTYISTMKVINKYSKTQFAYSSFNISRERRT